MRKHLLKTVIVSIAAVSVFSFALTSIPKASSDTKLYQYGNQLLSDINYVKDLSKTKPHAIVFGVNKEGLFDYKIINSRNIPVYDQSANTLKTVELGSDFKITWFRDTSDTSNPCDDVGDPVHWIDQEGTPRCANWGKGKSRLIITNTKTNEKLKLEI